MKEVIGQMIHECGDNDLKSDATCHRALRVFKVVPDDDGVLVYVTKKRYIFNPDLKFIRDNARFFQVEGKPMIIVHVRGAEVLFENAAVDELFRQGNDL